MPIQAGVVLVTKFVAASSDKFSGFINYIDRYEATRAKNFEKYNAFESPDGIQADSWAEFENYTDYMSNPEKATGLFTETKDRLSAEDKAAVKEVFNLAQQNGSLMWQTVISFDNRWLEENGIMDHEHKILNEQKLRDATRGCMKRMLDKEGLSESVLWTADIHINTDNVHIHVATVEPFPMREYPGARSGVRTRFAP
ncbi:MAG TPA: hypothetical protein DEQ02_04720, partial [Ruminococcaceae bacterium]|nr:hypothetical protein [Oscillospiraceae bacterium]